MMMYAPRARHRSSHPEVRAGSILAPHQHQHHRDASDDGWPWCQTVRMVGLTGGSKLVANRRRTQ